MASQAHSGAAGDGSGAGGDSGAPPAPVLVGNGTWLAAVSVAGVAVMLLCSEYWTAVKSSTL